MTGSPPKGVHAERADGLEASRRPVVCVRSTAPQVLRHDSSATRLLNTQIQCCPYHRGYFALYSVTFPRRLDGLLKCPLSLSICAFRRSDAGGESSGKC